MFTLALRNCIIVNILYGHEPYKEGLYDMYYILYTLAAT